LDAKFTGNVDKRGAYIAFFIAELIKKHPVDRLVLVGQSLGGMEGARVINPLKTVLEESQSKTNLVGFIFFQSGGIYEQDPLSLVPGVKEFMSMKQGIRELWPMPLDIAQAREKATDARTSGDMSEALHWERRFDELENKKTENPYLTDKEKETLKKIDDQLERVHKKGERKRLERKRYKLLSKVVFRISSTDVRVPGVKKNIKNLVRAGRAILLNNRLFDVAKTLPESVRESIDVPAVFVWGGTDQFFEEESARNALALHRMSTKSSYFPKSPAIFNARIFTGPHELACTDYEKFSDIIRNISGRILKFNDSKHDSEDQFTTNLYFQ